MATAAITAIDNYQSQSVFSAASQAVLNTVDAAYAMFGVEANALGSFVRLTKSGRDQLTNVKSEYKKAMRKATAHS